MKNSIKTAVSLLAVLLLAGSLAAESTSPILPDVNCTSAVLLDAGTGAVLFEKNGNLEIPPASMTKLVTLHLVYKAIAQGEISKDQIVTIDSRADFRSLPPHSSLMFLEKGQRVSVLDLMKGLAVPSGNDAAIALADLVAGSVNDFVAMMNKEVRTMGFTRMNFADASGLDENNRVTAKEFASFCVTYVKLHPEALKELHSLSMFTYPKASNIPEGEKSVYGPIKQSNRNNLLGRYRWADGLKTGYIDESGYNIALTAEVDGRRLVAVLLGGPGENTHDGSLSRAIDAVNLLSYGFYRFTNYVPDPSAFKTVEVYGGRQNSLKLAYPDMIPVTLPREAVYVTHLVFNLHRPVIAPVHKGNEIGQLEVRINNKVVSSYPVAAGEDIAPGSVIKRFFDWIKRIVMKPVLFRKL